VSGLTYLIPEPSQIQILVVDDNRVDLQLLVGILANQGYQVHPACSGIEALGIIQTVAIDLVLLNIRLPEIDGYQFCTQLKASPPTNGIPVIFVSGLGDVVDKVHGFEVGGVDYITKPYKPQEVLARVNTHLRLRYLQKSLEAQNAQLNQEIAERRRVEESLRQYERILAVSVDSVGLIDLNYIYQVVNPSYLGWKNKSYDEVVGHTIAEVLGETVFEAIIKPQIDRCFAGDIVQYEEWFDYPNIGPQFMSVTYSPYRETDEVIRGAVVSCRNLTSLKQAETTLAEREKLLELFFSQSLDGFFFMMLDQPVQWDDTVDKAAVLDYVFTHQRITKINPAMLKQYGATAEQFLGRTPAQTFAHDINQGYAVWREFFDAGRLHIEMDERKLDGTPIQVEVDYICLYDDEHRIIGHFGVQRDITERKQLEQAIIARETQFRTLVENLPGVAYRCLHTKQRQVMYVSSGVEALVGYPTDDFQAGGTRDLSSIVASHDRARVEQAMQDAIATVQPFQMEYQIVCADGMLKWVYDRGQPIFDAQGALLYLDGVIVDISDRKQTEAELQQAKDAAETASRVKDSFLANMSHELRTPLNIIMGFADLLSQEPSLSTAQKDTLLTIYHAGEQLLEIVTDVLDLSKLEAGTAIVNFSRFDLVNLLHRLREMFYQKAVAKGLEFTLAITPDTPTYINTDMLKLRQVLINLLSNAVKFTDQGHITLRVQREELEDSAQDCLLRFDVKDTGPGIDTTEQEMIFDAFVQSSRGRLTPGGTGLGLTISRRFVNMLGGELSVRSTLGQGSTFFFTLPVQLTSGQTLSSPAVSTQRVTGLLPNQPLYRILVVDDQPENRRLVMQLMQRLGLEIREATNSQTAITTWQAWQPHLIWMDLRMPDADGYETVRRIRSTPGGHAPVIIAMTAYAMGDDPDHALAVGFNDFVTKPFHEEILFKKLAEYLGLQYQYVDPQPTFTASNRDEENFLNLLSSSDLTVMPSEWITALYRLALDGNDEDALRLISEIPDNNSRLISELTQLVINYRFQTILQLIEAIPDTNRPGNL